MRRIMLSLALAVALVIGVSCGPSVQGGSPPCCSENETRLDDIGASGLALNDWIVELNQWVLDVNAILDQLCDSVPDIQCDPPDPPSQPPPSGGWGTE